MKRTIYSRDSIVTWVLVNRPDVADAGRQRDLVAAIESADHPVYGTRWDDWLHARVPGLLAKMEPR